MIAVLAAPATTAVASPAAVDQYTSKFPGAGGNSGLASGSAPVAQPGLLSARTRAELTGPEGQLLALIATAPGLGAPEVAPGAKEPTSGALPGLASAVADTFTAAPALVLVGALAAIAAGALAARAIQRRRTSL
jgi:hypothetical protein